MTGFDHAFAAGGPWPALVDRCAFAVGDAAGTLGLVYVTEPLAVELDPIARALAEKTGVPHWCGAVGAGVCASGVELFESPSMAILTLDLPEAAFHVFATASAGGQALSGASAAWVEGHHPHFGIVHGDPRDNALGALLPAVARESGAFLAGALTSATDGAVHLADGARMGGLSGVLFGEDVAVVTGLTQGCTPVSPWHEITAAEGHIVATLDDRPAFEVLRDDIGDDRLARASGYIYAALPVGGSDTGDYTVRNLIGADPDNGLLAIAADFEAGDRVMFVARDMAAAIKDLDRMLADVMRRAKGAPRAAAYHSCVARGPNLFGPNAEELRQVRSAIGEVPLAGFFGNGEISHDRLYGYTGVLTLFL